MSSPAESVSSVQQPPWDAPSIANRPQLRILNTLTRQKELFVPLEGNVVRWYSCGPTVYDAAHMGHARNYLTFDIIRRILAGYFSYDVNLVMNITDVDDKIILRARQAHLVDQFVAANPRISASDASDASIYKQVFTAIREYAAGKLKVDLSAEGPQDAIIRVQSLTAPADDDGKFALAQETTVRCIRALIDVPEPATEAFRDVLAHYLDKRLGHTVSEHGIFRSLAAFWERDFAEDMEALGVLPPDHLTRISEYIPEVVAYVERIMANGFAYEASGSVYFDVRAFEAAGHPYARLCPWACSSAKLMEEGEGSLGIGLAGKRHPQDFALWKASRPGEPAWPSAWGAGRPGWHIECSAMASAVLPGRLDMHSGGIDLAFPHHDNELAQAEAHSRDSKSWVSFFMHAGHVHIAGLKMSKSLKNFISIKEALERYTARQLRIMFLQHHWHATMNYRESSMDAAIAVEATLAKFFSAVLAGLRSAGAESLLRRLDPLPRSFVSEAEGRLLKAIEECQSAVHAALADSFDTPTALDRLMALVRDMNVYIGSQGICWPLIVQGARHVARIIGIFGVEMADASTLLGCNSSASGVDKWTVLAGPLTAFSAFRDSVRQAAIAAKDAESLSSLRASILTACDRIRSDLASQGVFLEDRATGPALIKLVDPAEAQSLAAKKVSEEAEALARRTAALALAQERERIKANRAKLSPAEYFRSKTDEFSAWDGEGRPTHDREGNPLSKNAAKRVLKEWASQEDLYQAALKQ